MLMLGYHKSLKEEGSRIRVFGVCPGFIATDIAAPAEHMRRLGAKEPSEGACVVRDVVLGKREGDEGRVVTMEGVNPW